ncbi:hypothetical protein GCM10023114_24360 [Mycolicibacterium sediminis]|uniref:Uncharacterized protein n=1 Tax=Mycolicibacterium sediminis TaxID=1286180 RepID=A0A7I7QJ01_9MYCO|nr:hypothetical protein MSEDJ_04150 [Mycolicibacterium sediminis]
MEVWAESGWAADCRDALTTRQSGVVGSPIHEEFEARDELLLAAFGGVRTKLLGGCAERVGTTNRDLGPANSSVVLRIAQHADRT